MRKESPFKDWPDLGKCRDQSVAKQLRWLHSGVTGSGTVWFSVDQLEYLAGFSAEAILKSIKDARWFYSAKSNDLKFEHFNQAFGRNVDLVNAQALIVYAIEDPLCPRRRELLTWATEALFCEGKRCEKLRQEARKNAK